MHQCAVRAISLSIMEFMSTSINQARVRVSHTYGAFRNHYLVSVHTRDMAASSDDPFSAAAGQDSQDTQAQDSETQRLDKQWEDDLVAFNRHKVMRAGFEESRQGNPRILEVKTQAAPLVALGSKIKGQERKLLGNLYDKVYQKPALDMLLIAKHPHYAGQQLNKEQVIAKLIDAVVGFPSVQEWLTYIKTAEDILKDKDDVGDPNEESDGDNDKDESKAQMHSRGSSRQRPLNVVKKKKTSSHQEGKYEGTSTNTKSSTNVVLTTTPTKNNAISSKGTSKSNKKGTGNHKHNGTGSHMQSQAKGRNDVQEGTGDRNGINRDEDGGGRGGAGGGREEAGTGKEHGGAADNKGAKDKQQNKSTKDNKGNSRHNTKSSNRTNARVSISNNTKQNRHRSPENKRSISQERTHRRSRSRSHTRSRRHPSKGRSRSPNVEFKHSKRRSRSPRLHKQSHNHRLNNYRGNQSSGRGPNSRDDPFYRREMRHRQWQSKVASVSATREADRPAAKSIREVEAIVKKQLDAFKEIYDAEMQQKLEKSQDEAYKKGRRDAEMKSVEQWIPPVDPKLVEKAKALKFIDLSEIKAALARSKSADKLKGATFKIDENTGTLRVNEEEVAPKEKEAIKWLEWQSLFADLMDYYLVQGGHLEKAGEILTHFRLMQRLGKDGIFTFESLQEMDRHIRSRPEGQGEDFTWRFDGGPSRYLYLKEYHPTANKEKATPTKTKKRNRNGVCYDWVQGKNCKFGERDCKFAHHCSSCKLAGPKTHILENCTNKASFEVSLQKNKSRKKD